MSDFNQKDLVEDFKKIEIKKVTLHSLQQVWACLATPPMLEKNYLSTSNK